MKDIIKGVIYDRGQKTFKGKTKHMSLIAMVVASDEPLVTSECPEYIVMGQMDLSGELKGLKKYECPYKFGDIAGAIIETSSLSPDDLEEL